MLPPPTQVNEIQPGADTVSGRAQQFQFFRRLRPDKSFDQQEKEEEGPGQA